MFLYPDSNHTPIQIAGALTMSINELERAVGILICVLEMCLGLGTSLICEPWWCLVTLPNDGLARLVRTLLISRHHTRTRAPSVQQSATASANKLHQGLQSEA